MRGCRLRSRQSCQWEWQGIFLPCPVPTLALPAATPLSRALGDERATAVPCTPSSRGGPARGAPARAPGASVRADHCAFSMRGGEGRGDAGELGSRRTACWGGMIAVFFKANVAGPENGSRMERSGLIAPLLSRGTRGGGPWPGARTRSSTRPLPPLPRCPPLILHQCRKCSTDLHIFPNIRDLFFFFFPLWEETGENPRKGEAGAARARKQGGFHRTQTRAHK